MGRDNYRKAAYFIQGGGLLPVRLRKMISTNHVRSARTTLSEVSLAPLTPELVRESSQTHFSVVAAFDSIESGDLPPRGTSLRVFSLNISMEHPVVNTAAEPVPNASSLAGGDEPAPLHATSPKAAAPRILRSARREIARFRKAWKGDEDGKRRVSRWAPELVRCVVLSPFWLVGGIYAGPVYAADLIREGAARDLLKENPEHSRVFWGGMLLLGVPLRFTIPLLIVALHLTTGIGGIMVTFFLEAVVVSDEVIKATKGRLRDMMIYRGVDDLAVGLTLLFSPAAPSADFLVPNLSSGDCTPR